MKKLIMNFAVWLIKLVLTGKYAETAYKRIDNSLTKHYQNHKKKIFKLNSEIKTVKKGKLRYKVFYYETEKQKLRIVIKRHPKKKIKLTA